jgi:hypothetical protein
MRANLRVAVLLCATLGAHGLHIQATHVAPRITDTALRPCSPLLARRPPRGQSLTMGAAPPAGFEWGEVDRKRWFDSMPSPLRRVGKPLLLLGALCGIASLPAARGRFWGLYHAYEAAAIARPLITKSATSGVAYLLGDTIAQRQAGGPLSRSRITRATIAGAISHGPQLHYWTVKLSTLPHPPTRPLSINPTGSTLPPPCPPARLAPRPLPAAQLATVPSPPPLLSSRYCSSARACLCSVRSLSTRWARYPRTPPRSRPTPCRLPTRRTASPAARRPLAAPPARTPRSHPPPLALSRRSSPCTSTRPSAC